MSQEVQNRGISGPTKMTDVLQIFFLKKIRFNCMRNHADTSFSPFLGKSVKKKISKNLTLNQWGSSTSISHQSYTDSRV